MTRQIINGKKYDTDTAKFIENSTSHQPTDFRYFTETLFQKKTGEFFIFGQGGALSKYAVPGETGGWQFGAAFTPLTENNAKTWVEEHSDVDLYEELFGEVSE